MLSPDDFTQPIAPVTGGRNNAARSTVDSKLESSDAGPKMVSFTLPAFGLVCATIMIGFACAFVIGRMTVTPVQAANLDATDAAPSTDLSLLGDPLDMTPTSTDPAGAANGATESAGTAPAASNNLWGFQVMQFKGDAVGLLSDKLKDTLISKGFSEVTVLVNKDTARVIVGGSSSLKTLEKTWKQKLSDKGYRTDPVKFTPPVN